MSIKDIESVLKTSEEVLKNYPNVLNVGIGKKIIDGKQTEEICIIVFVSKKVELMKLSPHEVIPEKVDTVCTDVVEMSPKGWVAGKTSASKKPLTVQKRIAGGVKV